MLVEYNLDLIRMSIEWPEYFEYLSLLFAIVLYKKLKFFRLSPFLWLLIIVCATETCAANLQWFGIKSNYTIYNYYVLVSSPISLWIFLCMLDFKGSTKKIYLVISGLIMFFMVLNFFFFQGYIKFDNYSFVMIEFVKGLLSLMAITKLLREDNYEISISSNPYFWISGGSLIFSIGAIVLIGPQQFILINKIQIEGVSIYRVVLPLLVVILYSSYCYAFYLCRKLTRKLSLQ